MTREENIRAILKSNFAGFQDEIIEVAVKNIMLLDALSERESGEMIDTYRFMRVEIRREVSAAVKEIIADKETANTFYCKIMENLEDFLSDKEVCADMRGEEE